LSIYLNVDQSEQANLNRGFETTFDDMTTQVQKSIHEPEELARFAHAIKRIRNFVSHYQPHARGLVMFFDGFDDYFWNHEVNVPVKNEMRWEGAFLTQPLADAVEQFDRYGVALLDRENLRLFTVFLGEIEDSGRKEFGPDRTRHIKASGSDNRSSESMIQRKADEQIRVNLRRAVMFVDSFLRSHQVKRLILAGRPEITAEFRDLLPKRLDGVVIGSVDLPIEATPQQIMDATRPTADDYERDTEVEVVDSLVTSASKSDKAVLGLGRTLNAVNLNRVWQLVYSNSFSSPGFECMNCRALFAVEQLACSLCGDSLRPVSNVVERAVEHALSRETRTEIVTGEAAASLESAGGIGAFLKTRTASIRA
jgi:peptide subunit release factor 1 (eRF1)